jgi:hypothetical protein
LFVGLGLGITFDLTGKLDAKPALNPITCQKTIDYKKLVISG